MLRVLKWAGIILGSLIGLIVVALVALYLIGSASVNARADIPAEEFDASGGDTIRGRVVAQVYRCTVCHGPDLSGTTLTDEPPFGYLPAPNLTSGEGGVGAYSDADFEHAIRHGITPEGKTLFLMPSLTYNGMANSELVDLIAYLRSVEPVDHDLGERNLSPIASILMAAGVLPEELISAKVMDHAAAHIETPPTDELALGAYHAVLCTECHGASLNGGPKPHDPTIVASNLTPEGNLGTWTEADFMRALREGITPEGHSLDAAKMPWPSFAPYSDADMHALWVYLQSLDPLPAGGTEASH